MLNELSQVVESLERLGLATESRHPRISPMGKNKDLLVICLAPDGKPSRVEIMEGDSAANLFRVEHGSAGSSFPGFNVPTPLRCLREAPTERLMPAVEHLLTLNKNKNAVITDFAAAIAELFSLSTPRGFTDSQEKQFQRCCFELVSGLRETLGKSPAELKNFLNLLAIVAAKKPTDEDWKKANAKSKKAKEATPEGEKKGTMKEKNLSEYRDRAFHDALCQNYFDVRYFGQVVSTEGPLKGSFYGQIRGPLQITFAESLDKILQLDFSITRCAVANETEAEKKGDDNRTMGRKHTVPYGLYRCHIHFSPAFAAKTHFTYADLDNFLFALTRCFGDFNVDGSSARPSGMRVVGLVDFQHSSSLGNAPAHKVFDLVKVTGNKKFGTEGFASSGSEFPQGLHDYTGSAPDGPIYTEVNKYGQIGACTNSKPVQKDGNEPIATITARRLIWEIRGSN